MKTPIKSFVVEVKRSRMSGSAAIRPDAAPLPKVTVSASIEGASPARQAAEKLFKALLTSPSQDRQDARVLDDVLGTVSRGQDLKEEPTSHSAEAVQAKEAPAYSKRIEAKAPANSARKRKNTEAVGADKSQKVIRRPKEAKAIHASAPVRTVAEVPVLPLHRFEDELFMVAPRIEAARQNQRERDWKPGERWRRRLRHMR